MSKKGRPKKERPKITRNVSLESKQLNFLLKKSGGDGKLSEHLRLVIDLYRMMTRLGIIKDLTKENIEKLTDELKDGISRELERDAKVMEYKEIFEEMCKTCRYLLLDIKTFPNTLKTAIGMFGDISFTNQLTPEIVQRIKNKIKLTNIVTDFDIISNDSAPNFTLKGEFPYSLYWYAKLTAMLLTISKHHWKIYKVEPEIMNERMREITCYFKRGESLADANFGYNEIFNRLDKRVVDPLNNEGVWNLLNNNSNVILDRNVIQYVKGNGDVVPYKQYIDLLRTNDPIETANLIMNFYTKINLISNLLVQANTMSFVIFDEFVIDMITNTLKYLDLETKFTEDGGIVILQILDS